MCFLNIYKIQKEIFRKINLKVPDDTSSKPKTAGLGGWRYYIFKPKFPLSLKKEIVVLCNILL